MNRMSISSLVGFGAGMAASYVGASKITRKSMKKMKRKVKSFF